MTHGKTYGFGRLDDATVARAAENPMENRRDADDENTAVDGPSAVVVTRNGRRDRVSCERRNVFFFVFFARWRRGKVSRCAIRSNAPGNGITIL